MHDSTSATATSPLSPRRHRARQLIIRAQAVVIATILFGVAVLWLAARDALGGRVEGARLMQAQASPQWRDGAFRNVRPRVDGPYSRILAEFFFGGSAFRTPDAPIPFVARSAEDYRTPPASGLRVTWLGHSTMLLEMQSQRILIDPVWGERVSPFTFLGPKRFHAPPLPLADLPPLDAVVISHDHYDHLDMPTIKALASGSAIFVVPLGVGAHLQEWGVAADRVRELDWWDSTTVGGVTLVATPARHFSGRGLNDAGRTLWSGWAMLNATHRVYYSGDTALDEFLGEVGERLGPFDLTMIEAGAYDAMWADVHLGPEQAVRAHQLVRGQVMLPVHWGLFDLALHGWTEPIERVLLAAAAGGVRVVTPRPGERVEPSEAGSVARWWPMVPWQNVREAPAWSSGVEHLR